MASELRVDTLKDSSGNNSVGMAYVAGGSAKAWVNYNASSGTPVTRDSLNVSSYTDNAQGDAGISFSSSFNNSDYALTSAGSNGTASANIYAMTPYTFATGEVDVQTWNVDASSVGKYDRLHNCAMIMGDLA